MKPDSPEYQEAYQKEMQRLEAEAGKKDVKAETAKTDDKAAATTSATDDKAKADAKVEAKTETDSETKARLEKVEKALRDTQRWGHENAAKVKRLEKEAEEGKRAATRPAILEANPGLEDAIKHVAGTRTESEADAKAAWLSTVSRAVPDVEQLLGDQAFHAKASARKAELGSEWDDPITAIRELSSLRTDHLSQKASQAAVEAARKDFDTKSKKRNAMEVPGGSGGKDGADPKGEDAAKRYREMSKEDFAKERSRVMGF